MNRPPSQLRNLWVLGLVLWLPLALTLVLALFQLKGVAVRNNDVNWVLHTVQVKGSLDRINFLVKDAEISEQDYLATGDPALLAVYQKAVEEIPGQGQALARLVADNPAQVAAAERLRRLIAGRLSVAAQSLSDARVPSRAEVPAGGWAARAGWPPTDEIQPVVIAMNAEEDRLLIDRRLALSRQVRAESRLTKGIVAVDLALMFCLGTYMWFSRRSRQSAETLAHATEARFSRVVESNAQGVYFWNRDGRVTGANDAFLRLVGYTRADLAAGRINWRSLTPAEQAPLDDRALVELSATGSATPFEKFLIRQEGTRVPVLIGSALFEDGRDEGMSFAIDLTEPKKLEQQFLRAQRMEAIGTLAGGIAHDLNNILTPIMLSVELLKLTAVDPSAKRVLETIEVSAKRGADIVRQVLSFARGVDGQRVAIDPRALVKELEHIIKHTFPKAIRLKFVVPDTARILGDPTQVHQVLLNLCINARDAMPQGGDLTICVEDRVIEPPEAASIQLEGGAYVMISVVDSGTGMSPNLLTKIFDPFFTTKESHQGTGLGLSTVMAILKSHKGLVQVESEPGRGTTFRVCLPAMVPSAQPEAGAAEPAGLPRGNGEQILVVDDEAAILSVTTQTLQAFGYRVLTAADGAEAIALYAQHRHEIALVITDMSMPVMDGALTINALLRINPAIKIIATSGVESGATADLDRGTGVNHFLKKPYTTLTLLTVVRTILDRA
jgi:PAS domain S-box-containing protein